MASARRLVQRAAQVGAPILLLGETGTGKSLVARVIHDAGSRNPFVPVNCAAIPEALFESELFGHRRGSFTGASEDRVGLIESAHGGTLLLDEVGDLPPAQQAKLLMVIEDGEIRAVGARSARRVDVRMISATSLDLRDRVEKGAFRRDLFHRIALLTVRLPPLRERLEDVPALADHFLGQACARLGVPRGDVPASCLGRLGRYAWPGNVRELAHALEAALILAGGLASRARFEEALDGVLGAGLAHREEPDLAVPRDADRDRYSFFGSPDDEIRSIRETLARCRGNRTRAARELGMSRNTLRDRMRRYGIG